MITTELKNARIKLRLSQSELARRCGLTHAQVSLIERGKVDPHVSNLVQMGRVLNMELVLVPKSMVGLVQGLQVQEPAQPAYTLDE